LLLPQGQQLQQDQRLRQHCQLAAVLPRQLLALLLALLLLLLLVQAWLQLVLLLRLLLRASLALPLLLLLHLLLAVAGLCHQPGLMGWESVLSHKHLHSTADDERRQRKRCVTSVKTA
jgi:uncharacterized membrane protein